LDRAARVAVLAGNVFEVHARLSVEPVYHHRLLTEREAERLAETLAALSLEPEVVQVVALPTWMRAAEILRRKFGWRIVYDCHDLLSGFRDMAAEIVAMETHTMTSADLVLFSAKSLWDLQQSDSIVKHEIVRNAVDFHHFASTVPDHASRSTAIRTAVYWGAIDDWFETGWIASAAASFHDVQFVIAGAVQNQPAGRVLSMVSNVQLLGELPYTQLPSLAAGADVGLIPFRRNALTFATNPIKLYEYFSHGLPVVATRLPETELYDGLIYPASSCGEFVDQLGRALTEAPEDARRQARMDIAKRESWDKRVEQILEALDA
jgi:glycosyltransferase involved in cell wall biosynthesis